MILVFGSINIDWVARVPSIPRPGETVLARAYETLFGGKGANQAVAAARASRGAGIEVAIACSGRLRRVRPGGGRQPRGERGIGGVRVGGGRARRVGLRRCRSTGSKCAPGRGR